MEFFSKPATRRPSCRSQTLTGQSSRYYFVSTGQAFAVTGLEAVLFLALIALVYKRQEN